MIIQALVDLYDRLERAAAEPGSAPLAPFGYSVQKVSFVVVLNQDGSLHAIQDARDEDAASGKGKAKPRRVTRQLVVPGQSKPSGQGINPCFLWDRTDYMLGHVPEAKAGKKNLNPGRVRACFEAFRARHIALRGDIADDGFLALCRFLEGWDPGSAAEHGLVAEVAGGFGVFQIRGREGFVHEAEAVREYWSGRLDGATDGPDEDSEGSEHPPVLGRSLLTNRVERLARLHEPAFTGVQGAQTSGAKIASFNCASFESYGKSQTYNAPVGIGDAFRYCTALKRLLADDRHRARLGDTTVVFWTERPAAVELFGQIIGGREAQDSATVMRVSKLLDRARQGLATELGDPATPFYVLGLAPNAARLSVRLWIPSTVGRVFANIQAHAEALALDGAPDGFAMPTLFQIVRETAPAKRGWPDEDRVPPRLVGELGRAVFLRLRYPASLLAAIVQRTRTDGWVNADKRAEARRGGACPVAHRRAVVIAACLRRSPAPPEIPMALDENHPDASYHLGRLFALLDTVAEDASERRVNRRDKYFAAASANPVGVFPRLLRLSTFDLKKIGGDKPGFRIDRERHIQNVCDRIQTFPATLTLEEQGLFCLGYYQQRQRIFNPIKEPAAVA